MSYNLKCCSFYPNNFDASALVLFKSLKWACQELFTPLSDGEGEAAEGGAGGL